MSQSDHVDHPLLCLLRLHVQIVSQHVYLYPLIEGGQVWWDGTEGTEAWRAWKARRAEGLHKKDQCRYELW